MNRRVIIRNEIEFKPGEPRCPNCLSKDLAPSLPRGLMDAIMRRIGRGPRHCRACGHRFYVSEAAAEAPQEPQQPQQPEEPQQP